MGPAYSTRFFVLMMLALASGLLGAFLVIDQGIATIGNRLRLGDGWIAAVLHYLSFLSILTNAALVAVYGWYVSGGTWLRWARHPSLHAFLAALIVLVGVVWHVLLAPDEGMSFSNIGLHYIAPALFVAWWLLRRPPTPPRFNAVYPLMLLPLAYAGWLLVRGATTGEYPYGFIDVGAVGYARSLTWMGALLLAQLALSLAFIAVGRWRTVPHPPGDK
ncbi:MAG: Pr6Pr family membrane protein [Pseudomonadota bacterium]